MDALHLLGIDGYELGWLLGLAAAAGLGWYRLRRHRDRQLLVQAALERIERDLKARDDQAFSLHNVVKRHQEQFLEYRGRVSALQRRLNNLEQQILHADACRRAIGTARRGEALSPLIKRGELNPAEAHLIQVVHGR